MAGRWVKLGEGAVRIDVALVEGIGQCIVFVPQDNPTQGVEMLSPTMTDMTGAPYFTKNRDTIISLGNMEAAKVLLHQVESAIDAMKSSNPKSSP